MFIYILFAYIVLGIIAIFLAAYNPFNNSFDFGLSSGWEFFWFQRYLIWVWIILLGPIFFVTGAYKLLSDISYVFKWKKEGSFTRKL